MSAKSMNVLVLHKRRFVLLRKLETRNIQSTRRNVSQLCMARWKEHLAVSDVETVTSYFLLETENQLQENIQHKKGYAS